LFRFVFVLFYYFPSLFTSYLTPLCALKLFNTKKTTKGIDTVYFTTPPQNNVSDPVRQQVSAARVAVNAFKSCGVRRVVLLSSFGAHLPSGTGPIVGSNRVWELMNKEVENLYTLRPGYFMENFLFFSSFFMFQNPAMNFNTLMLPVKGDATCPFISTADISKRAAEALVTDWEGHHVQELLGPADLSFDQVAHTIGKGLGKEIKHVNHEDAEKVLTSPHVGFSQGYAKNFVEMHRAIEKKVLVPEFPRCPSSTTETTFQSFVDNVLIPKFSVAGQL